MKQKLAATEFVSVEVGYVKTVKHIHKSKREKRTQIGRSKKIRVRKRNIQRATKWVVVARGATSPAPGGGLPPIDE